MASSIKKTVIVIDGMDFRRARIESFLHNWAAEEEVELVSITPEGAHAKLINDVNVELMIYNAGRVPSSSSEVLAEIRVLHALRPSAALVIVTDDAPLDDVTSAFKAGAQGYFSNGMRPELVLQALSFVLRGGTYFPPAAILSGHPSGTGPPDHGCGDDALLPTASAPQPDKKAEHSSIPAQHQEEILAGKPVSQIQRSDPDYAQDHAPVSSLQISPLANANETRAGVIYANGGKVIHHQMTERQRSVVQCLCQGDSNKVVARKLNMTETTVKVHVREIMRKFGVSNRTQVAIIAGGGGHDPVEVVDSLLKVDHANRAASSWTPR